jgi:hypothetical protein
MERMEKKLKAQLEMFACFFEMKCMICGSNERGVWLFNCLKLYAKTIKKLPVNENYLS